jgi:hypothetical protein
MSSCDILLATNVVLHFQRFDQVDWCELTGCPECTIVIAPILLRELEQKRISAASSLLRDRAGAMIEYLVSKMELTAPVEISPNITLAFVEHESLIDFATHRLVRAVYEDHYIAAALERSAKFDRRTFIASNEGALALKLRSRAVSVLRLPDSLRIPGELDPAQQKLRAIRSLIARLETPKPTLAVTFKNGEPELGIRKDTPPPIGPSLEEVRAQHPLLETDVGSPAGLHGRGVVERYNRAVEAYYSAHERYLAEMGFWLEGLRLADQIEFELHNEGTAEATDVVVAVRFPSGITILSMEDFPRAPQQPVPPAKLGTLAAVFGAAVQGTSSCNNRALEADTGCASVRVYSDERAVRFSARSIKQRSVLRTNRFWLTRNADLRSKRIEIDVEIAFEQGESISDKLAVTFSEDDKNSLS